MGGEDSRPHESIPASSRPRKATPTPRSGLASGEVAGPLADPLLDLRALTRYSTLSVRTLMRHLQDLEHPLPHYKVRGKILVRRSEFDRWMEGFRRRPQQDVPGLVDEVLAKFRR
jgi:hypothetical protein